jgi:4-hydroxy-tetrahydrodipicolinate synthase
MFKGIYTALLTPFSRQSINIDRFASHIDHLIQKGIHGLVPCGTTGEAPTLTSQERHTLLTICCQVNNKRIPIMAGVGTTSTAETVTLAQEAEEIGVDALLIITPYYNKPTQEGLFHHYKTIHGQTNLPIFLYSNPGRCGVEISVETILRLSELPRVKGLKDATNDLSRCIYLKQQLGDGFIQFTGEDSTSGAYLAAGGHGCISVTANIVPQLYCSLYTAWKEKNIEVFQQIQQQLFSLNKALFCQTSPIPLKYAASLLGICDNEVRLPLTPLDSAYHKSIQTCLQQLGVQQ